MTPPLVLGLIGKKRSGKDTLAAYLVADHGFARYAFADPLKATMLDLNPYLPPTPYPGNLAPSAPVRLRTYIDALGWERAKELPEVRRLLQAHGVAIRDHVDRDVWLKATMRRVLAEDRPVVITDVRFPNEADAVARLDRVGALVRIHRPGLVSTDAHVSETILDGRRCEWHVNNEGPVEFLGAAAKMLVTSVPKTLR